MSSSIGRVVDPLMESDNELEIYVEKSTGLAYEFRGGGGKKIVGGVSDRVDTEHNPYFGTDITAHGCYYDHKIDGDPDTGNVEAIAMRVLYRKTEMEWLCARTDEVRASLKSALDHLYGEITRLSHACDDNCEIQRYDGVRCE